MKGRVALAAFLALLGLNGHAAEDGLPFLFDPSPRIWGLDLGIGYPGVQLAAPRATTIWAYAGGGWERMPFWRPPDGSMLASYLDLRTGSLVVLPVPGGPEGLPSVFDPTTDPWHQRAEAKWQLGVVQGLLANTRAGGDLLSAFLFYRGRYDRHLAVDGSPGTLLLSSALPDREGILANSVILGVKLAGTITNPHHLASGVSAEISAEWGPSFFFNSLGGADYLRLNASGRLFVPLLDLEPGAPANRLNIYLGEFLSVDWATGSSVPIAVRQSSGGYSPRMGLGGAVRGVDAGSLDATLKAVDNLELRLSLPALFVAQIVPGALAFADAGWFAKVGEGDPVPVPSGVVASVGAGLFLNLFDYAQFTGYFAYRLIGVNANGNAFTPFAFGFSFMF